MDEEDHLETAIEDDVSEDWDEDEPIMFQRVDLQPNEPIVFQRVDLKSNLLSQHSLLTNSIHADTVAVEKNMTSQSCPARLSPSIENPRIATFNIRPPVPSPGIARRKMILTELSKSLRKQIFWERKASGPPTAQLQKASSYDTYFTLTEYQIVW